MVAVVAVAVVVVLVARVLVRDEPVIVVRADVLADVGIIVPTVVAIALEFGVTASHPVDVVIGVLIDVFTEIISGVRPGIGVDVLANVNVNIFAAVEMAFLEFKMPTPFE